MEGEKTVADLIGVRVPAARVEDALQRVWADGDAVLPLPIDAPEADIARTLTALAPAAMLSAETTHERLAVRALPDPVEVAAGAALVIPTSGSTGAPRGIVLSHHALAASTRASLSRLGARAGERVVLALPTHHIAGLQQLARARSLGVPAEFVDPRDPTGWELTGAHVALVPTQLVRALDAGVDLSAATTVLLGGGAPPPGLLERAHERGVPVVASYGMTETCGGCVYDGTPLDDVEVALTSDDLIRVRGPVLCSGERHGHEGTTISRTDAEGWLTTSDLGSLDDGRLRVLGRADAVVITGGENVPAGAVTASLLTHPDVVDAAVIGREDASWGQRLTAVVVARAPIRPPRSTTLRDHVTADHPAPWAPRTIVFVDRLPRDPMGKLPRAALEALVDAQVPSTGAPSG